MVDSKTDLWLCGYAAALAPVERIFGESKLVTEIMKCDGLTVANLQKAGVEEFDLAPIMKAHGMKEPKS